jgi:hypothetical protein
MGLLNLFADSFREPAECVVTIDGGEITDLYPYLVEVTVECSRASSCEAVLRFETRRDEHGEWSVQDRGLLVPWKRVVIEAAFGSHREVVMQGFLQQVDASYPEDQGAAVVVARCRDESLALDREHVRRTWGTEEDPISDAQILEEIVGDRHDLSVHRESAPGQEGIVQQNQDSTDVTFLRARGSANEGAEVYFGPLRVAAEPQPAIMVYAGQATNCLSFSVSADGHLPDAVAFDIASPEGSEAVEQVVEPDLPAMGETAADSRSAGLGDFVWRLSREGARSEEELMALARGKANEFALKVRAQGELDGSLYGNVLRVGHPVLVDGVGAWFGGTYYVDTVRHRFDTDGYRQAFTLLRNAYGDNL